MNPFYLFARAIGWTLFFLLIFFVITFGGLLWWAKAKSTEFTTPAHTTLGELINTVEQGWYTTIFSTKGKVTFLILGTDQLATRGSSAPLTDTLLLSSLDLKTGRVALFSLPRDLWSSDYKTKINAFYAYGQQRYPAEPERFTREVVEQMTGVRVQHTVVITLDTLAELIDQIGGIDVPIKDGFTDPQFPNPNVDVTKVHDPKLLYMTVTFQPGVEHMSGTRVLEYVRSRHSLGEQGTDLARANRQQDVILALIATLKNPHFYTDLGRDGRLYYFYQQHFAKSLSVTEAIAIGRRLWPHLHSISFIKAEPSIYPDNPQGTITHPTTQTADYQNQWVYIVRNPSAFETEVQHQLGFQ